MTGTPIQNNLMELWSLTNWLEFDMYAGKQNMKLFKRQIEKPCKAGDPRGFERLQVVKAARCRGNYYSLAGVVATPAKLDFG